MSVDIESIRNRLQDPLPGLKAQALMSPQLDRDIRFKIKPRPNARQGAVLLLLYQENGELKFPLMQRPQYDGHHSGQISLPGGKVEPADPDRIYTALREAEEEMGIPQFEVDILGTLSELYIPPSNFLVLPVVGYMARPPLFKPDPAEVDHIIEVPLRDMLQEGLVQFTSSPPGARLPLETPYYPLQEKIVWGATAMILSEFLTVLQELAPRS